MSLCQSERNEYFFIKVEILCSLLPRDAKSYLLTNIQFLFVQKVEHKLQQKYLPFLYVRQFTFYMLHLHRFHLVQFNSHSCTPYYFLILIRRALLCTFLVLVPLFHFPWLFCIGSLSFDSFSNILFKFFEQLKSTFRSIHIHINRHSWHSNRLSYISKVYAVCVMSVQTELLIILHIEYKKEYRNVFRYERSIRHPLFTFHLFKTIKSYSCTADPFSSLFTRTKEKENKNKEEKSVKKRRIN